MHDDDLQHHTRVLIYGGTFDPPHIAHAVLPAQAAEQLHCLEVVYVPAARNPLKSTGPSAPDEDRLAMLLLAIADVPNARVSTIELDRAGPSYTIDTLRQLRLEYSASPSSASLSSAASQSQSPRVASARLAEVANETSAAPDFRLLIGSDQALEFHRWKDWQQILTLATPAVMLRPPHEDEDHFRSGLKQKYSKVETDSWMNWVLRLPLMNISATKIRAKLRTGDWDALREWLDPAVLEYIKTNELYRA